MNLLKEFLGDVVLLIKFIFIFLYEILSLWFKNLFIPSKYLYKKVDNEIVLVTGAASGIGKLLAKKFLNLNSIVICVDINEDNLKETINEFKKLNIENIDKRLFSYKIDVASCDQIKILLKKIKNNIGNITIIVNNAGIMNDFKLLNELSENEIKRIFDVNILSHFWLCREVLPSMIETNKGHIINISSICGFLGGDKLTDYCSTKFAVYGFSESLRVELKCLNKNNNIIVSTVCPFHVKTPMFETVKFEHFNWLSVSMEPEYVANRIIHGILLNKELIYIPTLLAYLCNMFKGIPFTKFNDYANSVLAINAAKKKI